MCALLIYEITEPDASGSLFSLFLHCPLLAMLKIFNITQLPESKWEEATSELEQLMQILEDILSENQTHSWQAFMHDDFLSKFIARFVIAYNVTKLLEGDSPKVRFFSSGSRLKC